MTCHESGDSPLPISFWISRSRAHRPCLSPGLNKWRALFPRYQACRAPNLGPRSQLLSERKSVLTIRDCGMPRRVFSIGRHSN